ncbi:MAG: methyltransferase domain-containing protein [Chloroflexi bacterium]|nr:methyltransferase domain-containing protein [Chloroflexota bacterium]
MAGCGNPVAIAGLAPGERVLDLGLGGGIDCFLAAQRIGPAGEVWGLDMTSEMVQLARHNAATMELANVRFRLGEIEDIPVADASFDVVISNCVINLSTDKPRVLAEAFRVLAPCGRLGVSDMVRTRALTPVEARDAEAWAGCVAGALPAAEFAQLLAATGFVDVAIDVEDSERGVVSAYIAARRPA